MTDPQPNLGVPVERILGPVDEHGMDCDDCFAALDRYVELEHAGRDAEAQIPGIATHLAACPACAEEHASMRALLVADDDRSS
jgi:hypothetical protein